MQTVTGVIIKFMSCGHGMGAVACALSGGVCWKIGREVKQQMYAVTLNTEPTNWDEVEIQEEYSSLFRTLKELAGSNL